MNDLPTLLRAIADRPRDESLRLMLADWLEEAGDDRAEFLRLDAQLAAMSGDELDHAALQERWRERYAELPDSWKLLLSRAQVENCGLRLNPCPQKWHDLDRAAAEVRHCWACDRDVHFCRTIEEVRNHARKGHCVAVDSGVPRLAGDLDSGDTFWSV